jgi:predicted MPP superfamily phosphohydrolase
VTTFLIVAAIVLAFSASFVALHAIFIAPKQLTVSEHEVPIGDLGAAFEGYTIAVLADIHQPPTGNTSELRRAIEVVTGVRPQLIVLLGDYAASFSRARGMSHRFYTKGMAASEPLLRELRAPDGVIAVLGNHDYYHDGPAVAEWLRGLGATVLVNASVVIERDRDRLVVGGTDDCDEGTVDPQAGCAGRPDAPTMVLAHHPDSVLVFEPERRMDFVLSGHTHGGQVVLPWYGAPMTLSKVCTRQHPAGWVPNGRAPLLVSRGLGGDIPLRFNCPPELVLVRLKRGAGAPRVVRQWAPERTSGWRAWFERRRRPRDQQPA